MAGKLCGIVPLRFDGRTMRCQLLLRSGVQQSGRLEVVLALLVTSTIHFQPQLLFQERIARLEQHESEAESHRRRSVLHRNGQCSKTEAVPREEADDQPNVPGLACRVPGPSTEMEGG